jgi:hypothetical protein
LEMRLKHILWFKHTHMCVKVQGKKPQHSYVNSHVLKPLNFYYNMTKTIPWSQKKKPQAPQTHLKVMQNIENLKIWVSGVVKDFKMNVWTFFIKKMSEHCKFPTIESINFLVLGELQNCKFLETCSSRWCALFFYKKMVVDNMHAS